MRYDHDTAIHTIHNPWVNISSPSSVHFIRMHIPFDYWKSLETSLWKGGREMLTGEMPGCVVLQTGINNTHLEIAYDKIDR